LLCSELPAGNPAHQPEQTVQVFRQSQHRHLPGPPRRASHFAQRPRARV